MRGAAHAAPRAAVAVAWLLLSLVCAAVAVPQEAVLPEDGDSCRAAAVPELVAPTSAVPGAPLTVMIRSRVPIDRLVVALKTPAGTVIASGRAFELRRENAAVLAEVHLYAAFIGVPVERKGGPLSLELSWSPASSSPAGRPATGRAAASSPGATSSSSEPGSSSPGATSGSSEPSSSSPGPGSSSPGPGSSSPGATSSSSEPGSGSPGPSSSSPGPGSGSPGPSSGSPGPSSSSLGPSSSSLGPSSSSSEPGSSSPGATSGLPAAPASASASGFSPAATGAAGSPAGPAAAGTSAPQPAGSAPVPRRSLVRPFTVTPKDFYAETIPLTQALSELRTSPAPRKQAETERLTALLAVFDPDARFADGPFILPVPGKRRTAGYGDRRIFAYSNGKTARSIHYGIDFGESAGTPVLAPAAGRIVMAEERMETGNTIVIEHLPGVYSVLMHLSTILAAPGSEVGRGAVVGRVGSTGLSTGPHLHWEVVVSGVCVDPDALLAAPLLDKKIVSGALSPYGIP